MHAYSVGVEIIKLCSTTMLGLTAGDKLNTKNTNGQITIGRLSAPTRAACKGRTCPTCFKVLAMVFFSQKLNSPNMVYTFGRPLEMLQFRNRWQIPEQGPRCDHGLLCFGPKNGSGQKRNERYLFHGQSLSIYPMECANRCFIHLLTTILTKAYAPNPNQFCI